MYLGILVRVGASGTLLEAVTAEGCNSAGVVGGRDMTKILHMFLNIVTITYSGWMRHSEQNSKNGTSSAFERIILSYFDSVSLQK